MKLLSSLPFLGFTAAVVGPSLVRGSDVHEQESHVTELETEAKVRVLSSTSKNELKDAKIASLPAKVDVLAVNGWTPTIGQSWNYNLATPVRTAMDVDVFLIDMDYAQDTIDTLHDLGKVVVCYISIGTVEDWREDAGDFPPGVIGSDLPDWDGEAWLNVNKRAVKKIMAKRVLKAASMNCDGVEPDNMMVYSESDTGVSVSRRQQIRYNKWFAKKVQASGMKVGLKNSVALLPQLVNSFDFAVNESCNQYDECDGYTDTFLAQGKPVFNVEYTNDMDMCDYANDLGMDTIVKNYNLKSYMCSCADSSRNWRCRKVI